MTMVETVKQQVREFYDQVGWREVSAGLYQNARFEDLRPVAREYIHRCHLRVSRHLEPEGEYLLDAGSGPIQYPEYLEYSRAYTARVCADISLLALQEARRRIGDRQSGGHGLFVVADIANLPFKPDSFDAVISLHTIHHLPEGEHLQAYTELYRVMAKGRSAVVVNGWSDSPLMRPFMLPIRWSKRLQKKLQRGKSKPRASESDDSTPLEKPMRKQSTYVSKRDAAWLKSTVGGLMPVEVLVWRSVSVGFLRTFVHPFLGGRWFLRLLYRLEERFPHFLGQYGQYPLVVIRKME